MNLIVQTAKALACEVSAWTLNNIEYYPRVQLWKRCCEVLGLPVEKMIEDIKARKVLFGHGITDDCIAEMMADPKAEVPAIVKLTKHDGLWMQVITEAECSSGQGVGHLPLQHPGGSPTQLDTAEYPFNVLRRWAYQQLEDFFGK